MAPEFAVSLNPVAEPLEAGLDATLKIDITDSPADRTPSTVYYEGRYYSVNDTAWDRCSTFLFPRPPVPNGGRSYWRASGFR